jgi:hypothetical protein
VELPPNQSVPMNVHAENEGLYSIVIRDSEQREVAERNLQLADNRIELEHTGRDMENLKQWASLTGGQALTEEDAQDTDALIAEHPESRCNWRRKAAARARRGG